MNAASPSPGHARAPATDTKPSPQGVRSERTSTHDPTRCTTDAEKERCAASFERLLRSKGGGPGAGDGEDAPAGDGGGWGGGEMPQQQPHAESPFPLAAHAGAPRLQACAPADTAPRAPMETPVAARLALDLAAQNAPDGGRSFQVSMNERLGVPIEMRVVQPGAADPSGRWALSINSTSLNLAVLRRYSGRLDERLRTKDLSSEPVQIEHDDE